MIDPELLLKFLNKECSDSELREIDNYIQNNPSGTDELFEMERIWSLKYGFRHATRDQLDEAFAGFEKRIGADEQESPRRSLWTKRLLSYSRYAALVLLSVVSYALLQSIFEGRDAGMNTIEVPRGEQASLVLSDGTRVWLNSQSTLSYPTSFGKKNRKVSLSGEAYFEVTPDKKKGFVVEGEAFRVKVLGTTFNLRSYHGEETYVSLVEGKLEVASNEPDANSLIMNPNDVVVLSVGKELQLYSGQDLTDAGRWMQGELTFMDRSLKSIVAELNRYYPVDIRIRDAAIENELFTCRIHADATLEEVLEVLKATKNMDYIMDENGVMIVKP